MATGKQMLTLRVDDEEKMEWICSQHEKGELNVPVGPISTLVPARYHSHIPRGILKSLLCETEESASKMRKKIGAADIPVITKVYSESVYEHILKNLTDIGKDLIEEVHPWIINTLVDWANIDELICTCPIEEDQKQPLEEHRNISKVQCNKGNDDEETNMSKTSKVWKCLEIKTLIDLHMKKEDKFNKPFNKKRVVWQEISDEINMLGNTFSSSQCEQKWKNLTKNFRDTVDHNSKSGNEPKECPFFKDMEEAYGYKANVKPVFTLGSITSKETIINEDSDNESLNDSIASIADDQRNKGNRISDSPSSSETNTKKGKTNTSQNELLQFMQNIHKENKEEQEEFLAELKREHNEKMKKEEKKLELMSEMINLLKK